MSHTLQLELFRVCRQGCGDVLQSLIRNGANVNVRNCVGATLLMVASKRGNLDIVRILVRCNAGINFQDNQGCTAVMYAVQVGCSEVLQYLLASGASVNIVDHNGDSALILAARKGLCPNTFPTPKLRLSEPGPNLIPILVNAGACINVKNHDGDSAILVAVKVIEDFRRDTFESLLHAHADVNIKNNSATTALMRAVRFKNIPAINLLISNNANLNLRCYEGCSALDCACEDGSLDIIDILVRAGVDLCGVDLEGKTALIRSAKVGWIDTIPHLLPDKASINLQDFSGSSALQWAIRGGFVNIVGLLINAGAAVNAQSSCGMDTPLITSVRYREFDCFLRLLLAGADPDISNEAGDSALCIACWDDCLQMVDCIINHSNADVNWQNHDGHDPLHIACEMGNMDMVESLLAAYNVNINIQGHDGQTVLLFALLENMFDIAELLMNAGADVNIADGRGFTPLMYAASQRDNQMMTRLITAGANVLACDCNGQTALSICLVDLVHLGDAVVNLHVKGVIPGNSNSEPEVSSEDAAADMDGTGVTHIAESVFASARLLLAAGADVNAQTETGLSALMQVCRNADFPALAGLLLRSGANLFLRDEDGSTALLWAAKCVRSGVLQVLLDWDSTGAPFSSPPSLNSCPLEADKTSTNYVDASETGEVCEGGTTVDERLRVDLDVQDADGRTALMCAAGAGGGASGDTPGGRGMEIHRCRAVSVLLSYGARVDIRDHSGRTALLWAAASGFPSVLLTLLAAGAVFCTDYRNNTALHLAANGRVLCRQESHFPACMRTISLLIHNDLDLWETENADGFLVWRDIITEEMCDHIMEAWTRRWIFKFSDDDMYFLRCKDVNAWRYVLSFL